MNQMTAETLVKWFKQRSFFNRHCMPTDTGHVTFEPPPFQGQYPIRLSRAPEPRAIIYENFSKTRAQRFCRLVASLSVCLLVILASAALIVLIEYAKRDNIKGHSDNYKTGITALASVVTMALNTAISWAVTSMQKFEHLKTTTDTAISLFVKLAAAYVINTVLIYFILIDKDDWYADGGLAETGILLTVSNAIFANFLVVFAPDDAIWKWWQARSAVVQYELDRIYMPMEFDLPDAYAKLVKTVAIGLCFGPLCPIIYPLTLISLLILYWSWKYSLLRNCRLAEASGYSWQVLPYLRRAMVLLVVAHIAIVAVLLEDQNKDTEPQAVVFGLCGLEIVCLIVWIFVPLHKTLFIQSVAKFFVYDFVKREPDSVWHDPMEDMEPYPTDARQRLAKEKNSGIDGSWTYAIPTQDNLATTGSMFTGDYGDMMSEAWMPPPPPPQVPLAGCYNGRELTQLGQNLMSMSVNEASGQLQPQNNPAYDYFSAWIQPADYQDWFESSDPAQCHYSGPTGQVSAPLTVSMLTQWLNAGFMGGEF